MLAQQGVLAIFEKNVRLLISVFPLVICVSNDSLILTVWGFIDSLAIAPLERGQWVVIILRYHAYVLYIIKYNKLRTSSMRRAVR